MAHDGQDMTLNKNPILADLLALTASALPAVDALVTLAKGAVFEAQPPCLRLGGAAIGRAGLPPVCAAEPSCGDFVRATTHKAHLLLLSPTSPLFFLISQQL